MLVLHLTQPQLVTHYPSADILSKAIQAKPLGING
jgi:hypothetical protein